MSDLKDPAIKLFGKTIQLPSNDDVSVVDQNISCSNCSVSPKSLDDDDDNKSNAELNKDSTNLDKEQSESSSSQEENRLKKPDKIIPCPRCKSMDTKFCYFNNYNVNQPRHFCKNCQRYWTAGGSMRNVPIGSGRRKAKSCLNPRHIDIPNNSNSQIGEFVTSESEQSSFHGLNPQIPCFPAPPWYPAQWNSGYPVSILATTPTYLGYGVSSSCKMPWPVVSADQCSASSSISSSLGKHSREGDDGNGTKTKVLAPKTLRIEDPSEAAKSSIWATLGIRKENENSINSRGVFGGFESKGSDEMNLVADGSLVLQANPAAFSRSLRFHERVE